MPQNSPTAGLIACLQVAYVEHYGYRLVVHLPIKHPGYGPGIASTYLVMSFLSTWCYRLAQSCDSVHALFAGASIVSYQLAPRSFPLLQCQIIALVHAAQLCGHKCKYCSVIVCLKVRQPFQLLCSPQTWFTYS